MTDLTSLIFTLRPSEPSTERLPHLGKAAHAVFYDALTAVDPALAADTHDDDTTSRPFTTSGLIGYSPNRGLSPERGYRLRMTTLTAALSAALTTAAAEDGPLAPGRTLRLDQWLFTVASAATPDEHAPARTYESLSAPWLLAKQWPPNRIEFEFLSPTVFKSNGHYQPIPMPGWVFGSLLQRWNAFAPVSFPDEVRRYAEECLVLTHYDLRTHVLHLGGGAKRPGATGSASYTAVVKDRYWLSLIHTLADFAPYAGVGAGAPMGLGQVRRAAALPNPRGD